MKVVNKKLIKSNDKKVPFVYGKLASLENFTNRENETALLIQNFNALINTIIISPRRWGKSSLVKKAADEATAKNPKLKICRIDLFNVRNETHFYELLAKEILTQTSSKWEELIETTKQIFKRIVPKIIFVGDGKNEVSIEFDLKELKINATEILDMANKIAIEKNLNIVICIDEFQNIATFDEPDFFQKQLRAHWQQHNNVTYCLYGSKRHLMLDVFTNASMPFYKFGDLLFLDKIKTEDWIGFIEYNFTNHNKEINKQEIELIVKLADNHPYYVQQLAQQVWLRTIKKCSYEIINEAHIAIVEQLSLLFITITETLTTNQLNLLKALINKEKYLTSEVVLQKFALKSSANVSKAKKALVEKDILDDKAGVFTFQDPMYEYWLINYFF